ncbi:zinc-dependent metalloprotease family protein [Ferrimonas sp.]|uniref:zinc-dependent metalloprotease family protein n=1 Tax=Ferrimonas sp. TaxID=2080861 RepID=UPI003A8F49A4
MITRFSGLVGLILATTAVVAEPVSMGSDGLWNPQMAAELEKFKASRMVTPLALSGAREVDILVWLPDWAQPYPRYAELESMVNAMVAATNTYMENSQVAVDVKLKGIIPLRSLSEQGGAEALVTDFSQLDVVDDALNLQYGADLGMLLVPEMDDAAGIAFLPGRHSVVTYNGLSDSIRNSVAAHEIGHNFGAGHEGNDSALFPFSHAFDCGFGRTVMWSFVSPSTLPSYSSPLLSSPLGCGDAEEADNGRTLNESAEFIGNRAAPVAIRGTLDLDSSPASVEEGQAFELGISRSDIQGRAAATLLVSVDGSERLLPLTFEAGVERTSVSLQVAQDSVQSNRTLTAQLLWPGGVALGRDQHSVQIIDSSVGATGTAVFAQSSFEVTSGQVLAIVLNREGGSSGPLTVQLETRDGTAQAGRDYTALSLPVSFADGQLNRTVNLVTFDQGVARNLTLVLTAPGGLVSQATVALVPPVTVPPGSGGGGGGSAFAFGWGLVIALLCLMRRRRR